MTLRIAMQSLTIIAIAAQACLVFGQHTVPYAPQPSATPPAMQNYLQQQAVAQQQAAVQQQMLARQRALGQPPSSTEVAAPQQVNPLQAMAQNQMALQNFAMQQQAYMNQQQVMLHQQAAALQQAAQYQQQVATQQRAIAQQRALAEQQRSMAAQRAAQVQQGRMQNLVARQTGLPGQPGGPLRLNRNGALGKGAIANQINRVQSQLNPILPPTGSALAKSVPGTNSVMTQTEMAEHLQQNAFHQSPNPTITNTLAEQGKLGMASDTLLQEAMAYEKAGQTSEAIERYHRALEKDPGNWRALISFGRLKHRLGDLDGAIFTYQEVLKIHDNDPVALNDLGLCYARRGDLGNALTCLHKAVGLQEKSKRYRNNLATVLIEAGQPEAALTTLKEAHGEAIGEYNMAYLLSRRKRNMEAAAHLERALELDPSLTPARKLLSSIGGKAVQDVAAGPVKIEPVETARKRAVPPVPGQVKLQSAELAIDELVSSVHHADYKTEQPLADRKPNTNQKKTGDVPPDPMDYKIPGLK